MRRFSTLMTAVAVFFTVQANAQSYTESFEGGATPSCAPLTNSYTTTAAGEVINGTGSLYSNPPVNNSGTRDYSSPYLNITSTSLTISYWYKLNSAINAANTSRTIEVGLQSASGVFTTLNTLTIDKNSANQTTGTLYSFNATAPSTGLYRLVVKMGGNNGSGTVRTILDDISINANSYYSGTCNSAPVAVNDGFNAVFTNQPFTENVITNLAGGSDNDPNAGEQVAAAIVAQPLATQGTVVLNPDGSFTFTPAVGFLGGLVTFTYRLTDNGFTPLTSNTATVTIDFPVLSTLPVKLTNFAGSIANNKAQLRWSVAENETGDHFQVLRSVDGKNFTEAGVVFINGKVGAESYTYADKKDLDAATYYKLKVVNKDKSVSYSNVIVLKNANGKDATGISILKNPVESTLTFTYTASSATQSNVAIYNASGVKVYSSRLSSQKGINAVSLSLDSHMATGTYILEVANGAERMVTKLLKK